jgi:DNA-binding transcriptional regulator of glucitol operon
MKRFKIISIISFGILLLLIGVVLQYTAYKSQSKTLLQVGFIFELYALVLYIINRFKKSK